MFVYSFLFWIEIMFESHSKLYTYKFHNSNQYFLQNMEISSNNKMSIFGANN
jgi:hypothetical protein